MHNRNLLNYRCNQELSVECPNSKSPLMDLAMNTNASICWHHLEVGSIVIIYIDLRLKYIVWACMNICTYQEALEVKDISKTAVEQKIRSEPHHWTGTKRLTFCEYFRMQRTLRRSDCRATEQSYFTFSFRR